MRDDFTFTHVGVEANKILMNVIRKSQIEMEQFFENKPIILPSSNDNLNAVDVRSGKKKASSSNRFSHR
jgi:hypothetical protein